MSNEKMNEAGMAGHDQASPRPERCASGCGITNQLAMVFAIGIAALLQFAAFAKLVSADPKKLVPGSEAIFEGGIIEGYAIGIGEMVLASLLLLTFRWKHAWTAMFLFFTGLAGFAAYTTFEGKPCGCFGDVIELPRGFALIMDSTIAVLALAMMALKGVRFRIIGVTVAVGAFAFGGGWFYGTKADWPDSSEYVSPLEVRPSTTTGNDTSSGTTTTPTDIAPTPAGEDDEASAADASTDPNNTSEYFLTIEPDSIEAPNGASNGARALLASSLMEDVLYDEAGVAYYVFIHDPDCSTCEELKPFIMDAQLRFEEEGNPFIQVREFEIPWLTENLAIDHWAWESTPTAFVVKDGIIHIHTFGDDVRTLMPSDVEQMLMNGEF